MRKTTLVLIIILGVFGPAVLLWGDSSTTVQVGWRVLGTQMLSILGSDGPEGPSVASTFVIPQPTAEDLQRGYIERRRALVLVARSNMPWTISVRTDDENMGRSFDGTYVKPITDLLVRAEGGSYVTIGHRDQAITDGPPGEHQVGVDYRVLFDPKTHRDGNYHITVIYTISTP